MLLLLRRLKHDVFMSRDFRKYLAYAFGELLLVIVGILIALQIDNWNEDRKERATLQSYLENIARNMQEDLEELEPLRELRMESLYLMSRMNTIRNRKDYRVNEIFYFARVWGVADAQAFFSANTSGFEALKSSGVLNRLQGSGLEHLLSRYYDNVNQISQLESAMNAVLRSLSAELRQKQPEELEPWAILNPSSLLPERFEEAQPLFAEMIDSPTAGALVDGQVRSQALVLHYDSLNQIGGAFIRAVEAGQLDTVDSGLRTPLDDFRDGLGPADILKDGSPQSHAFWLTTASAPDNTLFRLDSIRIQDGAMEVHYPGGADWAVVYWSSMAENAPDGLPHQDFTRFEKLFVELRGHRGGELIRVHLKDADYPIDMSPVSIDLTLSTEWQTYEIDLAEFAPNDLARLHVPLGLLIYPAEDPLGFSVRNAGFR